MMRNMRYIKHMQLPFRAIRVQKNYSTQCKEIDDENTRS